MLQRTGGASVILMVSSFSKLTKAFLYPTAATAATAAAAGDCTALPPPSIA